MADIHELELPEETESSELAKMRREFCAELMLEVMTQAGGIRKWDQWAAIADHHYRINRQKYLDADVSGIISGKRSDKWIKPGYFCNPVTRACTRDHFTKNGLYIATVYRQGVTVVTDSEAIRGDHNTSTKALKVQGDRLSYRANNLNKKRDLDLHMIAVQTLLPSGN